MTEKQKNAYVDLLNIVQEDTLFLADVCQRIRDHVSGVKRRVQKIKANLEEGEAQ